MHMDSRLYQAIALGDINGLTKFESILPFQITITKNTVLHIAVQFRKKECVDEIYNRCPSLLCRTNKKGDTPLHIAARLGLSDIVEFLLDRAKILNEDVKEDVESGRVEPPELPWRMKNMQNDTALHEAVRNNHIEVVKLLTNVDPSYSYFANNAYKTPLYLAAEEGLKDIVDHISSTCPFSSYGGPNGMTALHEAVRSNNSEIARILLEKKAGIIKEADDKGRTPLHYAVYLKCDRERVVKQLLDCDSSVAYVSDKDGMTPLHFAARRGYVEVIEEITDRCPDCWEQLDNRGRNFLHVAVENCSINVVSYVLVTQHKMVEGLINEPDNDGNTPLHLAAIDEVKSRIAQLLCADDRVNKRAMNKKNLTTLDIVLEQLTKSRANSSSNYRYLEQLCEGLSMAGAIRSRQQRSIIEENEAEGGGGKEVDTPISKRDKEIRLKERKEERKKEWEKLSNTHLVVATLIATVTFAAGFTLPGGYKSEKGQDEGMATLSRKAAFIAFVISDIMALLLSTSAVFIHFWAILFTNDVEEEEEDVVSSCYLLAFYFTLGAIVAMVVAFVTGIYVVLANSLGLAITACVIGCSFYLFCGLYVGWLHKKLDFALW